MKKTGSDGMKIVSGKYPEETRIEAYMKFAGGSESREINLVFARRCAALFRDHGIVATGLFGYRSVEAQRRLYNAYIAYKNGKGPYANLAAFPGSSKHQYGLALDVPSGNNAFFAFLSNLYYMPYSSLNQAIAKRYGLIIPMNNIDAKAQKEPWHIQPVETFGLSKCPGWLDATDAVYCNPHTIRAGYIGPLVKEWERITGTSFTDANVKAYQRKRGLVADGIAGPITWRVVYNSIGIKI